jgi:predicted transcriptional regulator
MSTMTAQKPPPVPSLWRALKERHASADDILRLFNVIRPPVPVARIIQNLGVHLSPVPNPGWSGAVQSSDTRAEIWFSSTESGTRQRFTMAHELGHLMLHDVGQAFRDLTFNGSPQELQANEFAASLLMPIWMLDPVAMSIGADVATLASMFHVSPAAMSVRLGRLGR